MLKFLNQYTSYYLQINFASIIIFVGFFFNFKNIKSMHYKESQCKFLQMLIWDAFKNRKLYHIYIGICDNLL